MFPLSAGRTLASGTCPRVQVIATHPVEATLAGAPLLLHAVAAGAATAVCAVTPGESRPVAAGTPPRLDGVGALRAEELRRAARRLWVQQVDVLDRPDLDGLRRAIRGFTPDIIAVVAGGTPLHARLVTSVLGLGGSARVHLLHSDDHELPASTASGMRVRISTADHGWAWRRALAEHGSETGVPMPGEGAPRHVVLERLDGPRVLRQTLPQTLARSQGHLRVVPTSEARSA